VLIIKYENWTIENVKYRIRKAFSIQYEISLYNQLGTQIIENSDIMLYYRKEKKENYINSEMENDEDEKDENNYNCLKTHKVIFFTDALESFDKKNMSRIFKKYKLINEVKTYK
jgi:hypothetical protein